MQMVIDIPEEKYERLVYIDIFKLRGYIENGTQLPKNHGRLIDADELNEQEIPAIKKDGVVYVKLSTLQDLIDNAPTIIDADGSQET